MIVYKLKFVGDGEFIIISPPILRRLIEKVKKSSEKELTVEFDHLFPRPYQEYLLNVINSNSDEPYFSYEYIPKVLLDQKRFVQNCRTSTGGNEDRRCKLF